MNLNKIDRNALDYATLAIIRQLGAERIDVIATRVHAQFPDPHTKLDFKPVRRAIERLVGAGKIKSENLKVMVWCPRSAPVRGYWRLGLVKHWSVVL